MSDLSDRLDRLEAPHRRALLWFWDRRGQEITWPKPLEDGLFLMNRAKGIHKPKGWRHVLSVRETLGGPYANREPVERPDGSWSYEYFQEGGDLGRRDLDFTNRALSACAAEDVPIAVLRQTRERPVSTYRVLGLAAVGGWAGGYFTLEGYAPEGARAAALTTEALIAAASVAARPLSLEDARRRIEASIVLRQGGRAFRASLIKAYGGRCTITACDTLEALEAAHIVPYRGPQTDAAENGLLLRADLHTLFDRELLDIDPKTLCVQLAPALMGGDYAAYSGKPIRLPEGVTGDRLARALELRRQTLGNTASEKA